jgi:hypothetical protein
MGSKDPKDAPKELLAEDEKVALFGDEAFLRELRNRSHPCA